VRARAFFYSTIAIEKHDAAKKSQTSRLHRRRRPAETNEEVACGRAPLDELRGTLGADSSAKNICDCPDWGRMEAARLGLPAIKERSENV
jgi:hypothetical protein